MAATLVTRYAAPAWLILAGVPAPAPLQLYEVTTETGMPHLEENLRYTITQQKRCLTREQLFIAFPILAHPALKGCSPGRETRAADSVIWRLDCEGGHGASGKAVWRVGAHQIRGTLDIKLGGKNMTFYQRVTAVPFGKCVSSN